MTPSTDDHVTTIVTRNSNPQIPPALDGTQAAIERHGSADDHLDWAPGAPDDWASSADASTGTESALESGEADHHEVQSSGAESFADADFVGELELDALDESESEDANAPEFAIDEPGEEWSSDEEPLEVLPELGGDPEFFAAILPAIASAALPIVAKAGSRAIRKAVGRLSKRSRRRYNQASVFLRALHPAAKLLFDAVRQKELALDPAGEESMFDDPDVIDRIAQTMEIILGSDDRTRVFNTHNELWRKICALRIETADGRLGRGTGFLVGERTVLTAGHCVFAHGNGGWVKRVTVIPGAAGSKSPHGSWTSNSFRSVRGWTKGRSKAHDYACIQLPVDADTVRLGRFGVRSVARRKELLGRRVTVAGFPGDKPFAQLWKSNDRIKSVSSSVLTYRNDTTPGMSGSPVFVSDGRRRFVVGIHNYGATAGNRATLITPSVHRNVARWVQAGSTGLSPKCG